MAGGKASRMGEDKLALPWKSTTILGEVLACTIETIQQLHHSNNIKIQLKVIAQESMTHYLSSNLISEFHHIKGSWILSVRQPLANNIRLGLHEHSGKIAGIGFLPGDQIGINTREFTSLIEFFVCNSPDILVPFCNHNGSPVIFHKQFVQSLNMLHGEQGGKQILQNYSKQITHFRVSQSFLKDVDTPEDYQMMRKVEKLW